MINPGLNNAKEISKNTIISYHFNLLTNHPCVAAVNTNIAIKDVIMITIPWIQFSIPISKSSLLKINTIGKIPVLKLYQKA